MAQQPLVGQGLLVTEASRSHSDTPHSVGLLWTSDQPDCKHSTENYVVLDYAAACSGNNLRTFRDNVLVTLKCQESNSLHAV
jgi:hypothetical protein